MTARPKRQKSKAKGGEVKGATPEELEAGRLKIAEWAERRRQIARLRGEPEDPIVASSGPMSSLAALVSSGACTACPPGFYFRSPTSAMRPIPEALIRADALSRLHSIGRSLP